MWTTKSKASKAAGAEKGLGFWTSVRLVAGLLIFIPDGYFRLQPLLFDALFFIREYGFAMAMETALPFYFLAALPEAVGYQGLGLAALLAVLSLSVSVLAARGLYLLMTHLIHRLGFRIEERVESHLLHGERGAS